MARHPGWTRRFLDEADFDAIAHAIHDAESRTSGQIRVHLERRLPSAPGVDDPVLARAREVLVRLEMHRTRLRNAVLLYLALEDRRLAIVGDEGIHRKVGDAYWASVRDALVTRLKAGTPREAIVHAVADIGRTLAKHFPGGGNDPDELEDEVSTS